MKFLNLMQNTQEWELFRRQKIGASDAPWEYRHGRHPFNYG